jgi:hypothetical protein
MRMLTFRTSITFAVMAFIVALTVLLIAIQLRSLRWKGDVDDLNEEEGLLLRAADLIGQLADPNYMRKSNALFHEFEEIGPNKTLGSRTPVDIVYKFPQFYWTNVAPQIQLAIRYLNVTSSGRQWIANLHSNVFQAEREVNLSGPQR